MSILSILEIKILSNYGYSRCQINSAKKCIAKFKHLQLFFPYYFVETSTRYRLIKESNNQFNSKNFIC